MVAIERANTRASTPGASNRKAAEAFVRPGGLSSISLPYPIPRESSVGSSITAVVVSP